MHQWDACCPAYGPHVPGPSLIGAGRWPNMDYSDVDPSTRAACEFLQSVVRALEAELVAPDEATRHSVGLTRSDLARRAGVSPMSVTELLAGRTFPRVDTLVRICHVAGIRLGTL